MQKLLICGLTSISGLTISNDVNVIDYNSVEYEIGDKKVSHNDVIEYAGNLYEKDVIDESVKVDIDGIYFEFEDGTTNNSYLNTVDYDLNDEYYLNVKEVLELDNVNLDDRNTLLIVKEAYENKLDIAEHYFDETDTLLSYYTDESVNANFWWRNAYEWNYSHSYEEGTQWHGTRLYNTRQKVYKKAKSETNKHVWSVCRFSKPSDNYYFKYDKGNKCGFFRSWYKVKTRSYEFDSEVRSTSRGSKKASVSSINRVNDTWHLFNNKFYNYAEYGNVKGYNSEILTTTINFENNVVSLGITNSNKNWSEDFIYSGDELQFSGINDDNTFRIGGLGEKSFTYYASYNGHDSAKKTENFTILTDFNKIGMSDNRMSQTLWMLSHRWADDICTSKDEDFHGRLCTLTNDEIDLYIEDMIYNELNDNNVFYNLLKTADIGLMAYDLKSTKFLTKADLLEKASFLAGFTDLLPSFENTLGTMFTADIDKLEDHLRAFGHSESEIEYVRKRKEEISEQVMQELLTEYYLKVSDISTDIYYLS